MGHARGAFERTFATLSAASRSLSSCRTLPPSKSFILGGNHMEDGCSVQGQAGTEDERTQSSRAREDALSKLGGVTCKGRTGGGEGEQARPTSSNCSVGMTTE
jgi:hypothetical protein